MLAACNGTTAPDWELRAAQARWSQRGLPSYDITVSRGCECLPESTGPAVVSVRDGIVVSRTYVSNGAPVGLAYAESYPTVEGLFKKIDDARRQNPASLEVDYDPTFGYPRRIAIDYDRQMVDDEIVYYASDFHQR
jgi:hypothetical protein